eukprot:Skav213790  [mRNA]  locus=scaffold1122:129098:132795:- [translate_table: standard]
MPSTKMRKTLEEEGFGRKAEDGMRRPGTGEERKRKEKRLEGSGSSPSSFTVQSFTPRQGTIREETMAEEVEALISEAQERARGEFEARENRSTEPSDSQSWRKALTSRVRQFLSNSPSGRTVGDVGEVILDALKILVVDDCRPLPTGKSKSVFPLPLPQTPGLSGIHFNFQEAMVRALNSMHGCCARRETNASADRALKKMVSVLEGSPLLSEPLVELSFKQFFDTRGIDYVGDEVRLARHITWEGIAASLPSEVGKLDIRDFCEGGILEYVTNFENYFVPKEDMKVGKVPKTMVRDEDWEQVATGLVERGLCEVMMERDLFHVGPAPLLNGLFAVSKEEFSGTVELLRLIMNLKPLNALVRALEGDTCTLPSITSVGSVTLNEDEVLTVSSADIRCFFYLFRVPQSWFRNVVRRCMAGWDNMVGGHQELRRDKVSSSSQNLFRIYLDNFDQLEKLNRPFAALVRGQESPVLTKLKQAYEAHNLPIHPKKSVYRQWIAEVQGALIDGDGGRVMARPPKISRYVSLVLNVLAAGKASQKELQIVGGGLVYTAMFRRPLLCGLNALWKCIIELDHKPVKLRVLLPREVLLELARFVALLPFAFINLRAPVVGLVTASDASTTGGGICISRGLSPYGLAASQACVRGDIPEPHDFCQVLTVGLFDGISALRLAAEILGLPVAGHVAVEKNEAARRVTEANFPETIAVETVEEVDNEMVLTWSLKFGNVGLVILGAGPPCQGVSGLNSDRRGALRDTRSNLYTHVPRVEALLKKHFKWAQVHRLVESVGSMDYEDCQVMNDEFESQPWFIDAGGITLAHRPRVYWTSWELLGGEGVEVLVGSDGRLPIQGEVQLTAVIDPKDYLEPGCSLVEAKALPTFTTARPSPVPLRRPAGLKECRPHEVARWAADKHRFPPYQYRDANCVLTGAGEMRPPTIVEREAILGFPIHYTLQSFKKALHNTEAHRDCRLTLVGNTWCVPVICWLLQCLVVPLGLVEPLSLQGLVDRCRPGCDPRLSSLLLRPPLRSSTSTYPSSTSLVQKLCGLVSVKGEDMMLQQASAPTVRHHRLRASVPSKLWRWSTVTGWHWSGSPEHINVLELRAAMTCIRYRIEELGEQDVRCVHLVDSLVVLHGLARGRTSSRKMRRTLMRLNSLLLVSGLQPTWGYVDTHQNPADKPSRRPVKKPWVKPKRRS